MPLHHPSHRSNSPWLQYLAFLEDGFLRHKHSRNGPLNNDGLTNNFLDNYSVLLNMLRNFHVYHLPLLFFVLQSTVEMNEAGLCMSSGEPRLCYFLYSFVRASSPNTLIDSPSNLCNSGDSRRQRFLKVATNVVRFLKLFFYNILNYCTDN